MVKKKVMRAVQMREKLRLRKSGKTSWKRGSTQQLPTESPPRIRY